MARSVAQQVEPAAVENRIVTREFHRGAKAITGLHRRDGDAVFFEYERNCGTSSRPGHGDRVARTRLNRNPAAKLAGQKRRPRPGRNDKGIRRKFSSGCNGGQRAAALSVEPAELTILQQYDATFDQ